MNLFKKKKPELIAIICAQCGGQLELDSNFETAHCTICGTQHVVQNVDKKKRQKRTNFEMVMDFVEKERDYKRKDKVEKRQIKAEKEIQDKEERKKATKVLIVMGIVFAIVFAILIVLSSLDFFQ